MNEQQRILEMIEKGQISAIEGMELLEALKDVGVDQPIQVNKPSISTHYKFLKVKVIAESGNTNVNVNIPIKLLLTLGEISKKMVALIPAETRKEMEEKGIDITSIDFARIIEDILNGTLDDPTIVDVEVNDKEDGIILVKIYVE